MILKKSKIFITVGSIIFLFVFQVIRLNIEKDNNKIIELMKTIGNEMESVGQIIAKKDIQNLALTEQEFYRILEVINRINKINELDLWNINYEDNNSINKLLSFNIYENSAALSLKFGNQINQNNLFIIVLNIISIILIFLIVINIFIMRPFVVNKDTKIHGGQKFTRNGIHKGRSC